MNGLISRIEKNTGSMVHLESIEPLMAEYLACCNAFIGSMRKSLPALKK